jgi:hypothetical protein
VTHAQNTNEQARTTAATTETRTDEHRGDRVHRPATQLRAADIRQHPLRLLPRERWGQGDNAAPLNGTPQLHHQLATTSTGGRVHRQQRVDRTEAGKELRTVSFVVGVLGARALGNVDLQHKSTRQYCCCSDVSLGCAQNALRCHVDT